MKQRVTTQRLGLGQFTDEGEYYPKVDGKPVGEGGRAFWPTREEATAVGRRFLTKLLASQLRVV